MAKRQNKLARPADRDPVVEAARRFCVLSIEVQRAHIAWQSKSDQWTKAREALWAATRALLQDETGPTNPPRGRRRRFFKGTLRDVIREVMADGRTRSTEEVMVAVQKLGYGSNAKPMSLFAMVRAMLGEMVRSGELRRVARGMYVKA